MPKKPVKPSSSPRPAASAEPVAPRGAQPIVQLDTLTTVNKILVAALSLDRARGSFTAEDLIVRTWTLFPESFGLNGYKNRFPDSNRVLAKLMGAVGLCSRGWLEQVSTKTYVMTSSGRKVAQGFDERGKTLSLEEKQRIGPLSTIDTEAPPPVRTPAPTAVVMPEPARPTPKEPAPAVVESAPKIKPRRDPEPAVTPVARPSRPIESKHERPVEKPSRPAMEQPIARPRVEPSTPLRPTTPAFAPSKPVVSAAPQQTRSQPVAPPPAPPAPVTIAPGVDPGTFEHTAALQRLATSLAFQKFNRGAPITFLDACAYWSVTPSAHTAQLVPRLQEVEQLLKQAEAHVMASGRALRITDRLELTLAQVFGLQGLHRTLMQKYQREIEGIRGRSSSNNDG